MLSAKRRHFGWTTIFETRLNTLTALAWQVHFRPTSHSASYATLIGPTEHQCDHTGGHECIICFSTRAMTLFVFTCNGAEYGTGRYVQKHIYINKLMMTSSNGNIFLVTGHLCGEVTGPRWIPHTKTSDADFDVFFDLRLNKRLSKQSWGWWFETLLRSLWRHRDVRCILWVLGSCYRYCLLASIVHLTLMCVSELSQHCFRFWFVAWSAPNHYLNQCCLFANGSPHQLFASWP